MRFLLLIALLTFSVPCHAQRIFRASIDEEQNARLDKLESAVDKLTTLVEKLAEKPVETTVTKSLPFPTQEIKAPPVQRVVTSNRYTGEELEAIVRNHYPRGDYTRYADVSPRSGVWRHLQDSNHGFTSDQVNGMNQNIALGLHGLHHAGLITATKKAPPSIPETGVVTTQKVKPQNTILQIGGCANGNCARVTTVRRGIFFR